MKRFLQSAVVGTLLGVAGVHGTVVINELMYHPSSGRTNEQFIELLNLGPAAQDLAGWRISGAVDLDIPAGSIPAGGFAVVAADTAAFKTRHPGVALAAGNWTGVLGNGDTVRLKDAAGATIDSVSHESEGDWSTRRLGPPDRGFRGWEWIAAHDGGGSSLELVDPRKPRKHGQNWDASRVADGTPGAPNSVAREDDAPLVLEVAHFPLIPGPADPVSVTARLLDEATATATATLFWRVDTTPADVFQQMPMRDDGAHGDGTPGDGIFGAVVPPHAQGTIVEFHIVAADAAGNTRTYPRTEPAEGRTADLLFQVDDRTRPDGRPLFRLVMTASEKSALDAVEAAQPLSDAASSGAFIAQDGTGTEGRQLTTYRNRGHGTRSHSPHNIKVKLPADRPLGGRTRLNLNSYHPYNQALGSAVMRRLGLVIPESRLAQVRINGADPAGSNQHGSYAANWGFDNDLVKTQLPQDAGGNLYRGIRGFDTRITPDLVWHGADPRGYTNAYFKQNNLLVDDWTDLIGLIASLNSTNGFPAASYAADVAARADVDQWMRYFAAHTLLADAETTLGTGYGDDYGLYRGLKDTRFQLLPYDMDTLFGQGDTAAAIDAGLFRMTGLGTSHHLPAIDRLMKSPEFAPAYYRHLKAMAETVFAPAAMADLIDQVYAGTGVPVAVSDAMKSFSADRTAWVRSQIPLALTVESTLPVVDGYPRTTFPTVMLTGSADATRTTSMRVGGAVADYVAWQARWTNAAVSLRPGLNRVLVQSIGLHGTETERTTYEVWYDDGSVQSVGGSITTDTTWTAAGGPFLIDTSLTVSNGATLTIGPGTTVHLGSGVKLTVANGGRLLAEGTTDAPIRFGRQPGTTASWAGLVIDGAVGSPETRIAHAHFEGNGSTCIEVAGGTVRFDHLTFGTTTHQYLALDGASFVLEGCVFPTSTAGFELVHGTQGVKAGGHGIVRGCFFGSTTGYNDIMDFTGGNRDKGQPIIQFYDNVLVGGSDDGLDLDGTDAWIEGNIFLHFHKNGAPDSSSAVSGGNDSGQTSEITMIGNLFFDCDQAATAKQGNFFTLLGNTIVHTTKKGGLDTEASVVNPQDRDPGPPTTYGRGFYLEGNIVADAEQLVRNHDAAQTTVTWVRNLLPVAWNGPGSGNIVADPQLMHVPTVAETQFTTWEDAQILREWFRLRPGSPARGAGPDGRDMGGVIPHGVSISGAPTGTTDSTSATLKIGPGRTGSGIPATGFPNGSGFTHYKWRFIPGDWSNELVIDTPIQLTGLTNGGYQIAVVGKNDAGTYQDDPLLGPAAGITTSLPWRVDTRYIRPAPETFLKLNEVLARNDSAPHGAGIYPDLVELHNGSPVALDLASFGLSTRAASPHKFRFPAGTTVAADGYLVLYGGDEDGSGGLHLGFKLGASGDSLFLSDARTNLLDSVTFGPQLPDRSIGRLTDGSWVLNEPTPGSANRSVPTGAPSAIQINEWLAAHGAQPGSDFIELFNPGVLPVDLGGLFLANAPGDPAQSPLAPLSFIAGRGLSVYTADGDGSKADHVGFTLFPEAGSLFLSAPDLSLIDAVVYGPQTDGISQGRSPDGGARIIAFTAPTPGGGNPRGDGGGGGTNVTTITLPLLGITDTWRFWTNGDPGSAWRAPAFDDAAWPSGRALLYHEDAALPAPKNTPLPLGRTTYYFRAHFTFATHTAGVRLSLRPVVDDGAVFWLNGQELTRTGMPAGVPAFSTFASRNVGDAAYEGPYDLPADLLRQGDNVLAVEVHQINASSSDLVFGAALDATRSVTNSVDPGPLVTVVLNEVLAHNHGLAEADGTYPDWIELHNPNDVAVDLAGLSLTDDLAAGRKSTFGTGASLAAHGFLRIRCDATRPSSDTSAAFGLDRGGATVFLVDTAVRGGAVLDSVAFGLQVADRSIGRVPDGTGAWKLARPTPGSTNAGVSLAPSDRVKVNEWMAAPSTGEDWFELFNPADDAVELSGHHLSDDLSVRTKSTFPPLSFLGGGTDAHVLIRADGTSSKGADHVGFKLSAKGDDIGFFAPDGTLIDAVTFGPQAEDVSEGRLPDGGATLVRFPALPTPGLPNRADQDSDGIADDWELAHGLDPADPADAALDRDHDGASALAEFVGGTDPSDPASTFRLIPGSNASGGTTARFSTTPGRGYRLQSTETLGTDGWTTLLEVPPRPVPQEITFTDAAVATASRYYRVLVATAMP